MTGPPPTPGWAAALRALAREAEDARELFGGEGRFAARRPLGHGRHGVSYLVFDAKLERELVLRRLAAPDLLARVGRVHAALRERPALQVAGPLEVSDHPTPHYTRPFVVGRPLEEQFGDADRGRAYDLFGQVAVALVGLHAAGVVHGALHGRNVVVDARGRAVLVDAGLAEGSEAADWAALGELFADHLPDTGLEDPGSPRALCLRLAGPPSQRPTAAEVLATLMLRRDPGLSTTRYRDLGWLGRGGMGEVRRVEDPVLQRVVALKAIRSDRGPHDQEARRRFLDEARITASLQHPGIVPVHELNEMPDGTVYFTMKQIVGRTLAEVIREHHQGDAAQWPLVRLIEAFHRVCETVAYAHANGTVHRDLHPGNIMVGEFGEVRVLDWGLAVRLHGGAAARQPSGVVAGTPGYMPEEQAKGQDDRVGPHTDVFALGAILYEILTGARAFDAATTSEKLAAPARGEYVPVLRLRRDAPRELAAVVDRALRPRPEDRYPTARELAADLEAWQRGDPVAAYRYTPLDRLLRRARPYQIPLVAGLLVSVLLGSAGTVAWTAREDGRRDRAQLLASRSQAALATGDRVHAEALAVAALALQDRPEARGVLARVGAAWYPALLARTNRDCAEAAAADTAFGPLCDVLPEGTVPDEVRAREPAWGLPTRIVAASACGDGTLLRTGDGGVLVVDPEPGAVPRWLRNPPRRGTAAARCSPDGAWIALGVGQDVHVWRLDPLEERLRMAGHLGRVRELAWSADGTLLASGGEDGTVRVWSTRRDGVEIARLPAHENLARLAFTPEGDLLVDADGVLRRWGLSDRSGVATLPTMVQVSELGWAGEGKVATLDAHGTLRRWSSASGGLERPELRDPVRPVVSFAEEPGGDRVAVARADGTVEVLDAALHPLWTAPVVAGRLAWSPAGDTVAAGGPDGVALLDAGTGDRSGSIGLDAGQGVRRLAWSRDGERLLVQGDEGTLRLFARGHDLRWPLPRTEGPVALRPAGDRVAVATAHGVELYGPVGRTAAFDPEGERVTALDFDPSGDLLATAGADHTVRVWDADTARERSRLLAHSRGAVAVAFSPDGATLATAGTQGDVLLWDTSAVTAPVEVLREGIAARYGVAFDEGALALQRGELP